VRLTQQVWILVPQLKGTEVAFEHVAVPLMDMLKEYDETVVTPKVHGMTVWVVYHMQTLMIDSLSRVSSEKELLAYRAHLAKLDASLANESRRRSGQDVIRDADLRLLQDNNNNNNVDANEAVSRREGSDRGGPTAASVPSTDASVAGTALAASSSAWSFANSLVAGAMSRLSTSNSDANAESR
jgi:hypothetical protein